jgi:hypothetical protein
MTDDIAQEIAKIPVELKRDPHLADCSLALKSGPEATLACAYCGRARWMHSTRHDTRGSFRWLTSATITAQQIEALRFVPGISLELRKACSRALNDFGAFPGDQRAARQACASAINTARDRCVELNARKGSK